MTSTGLDHDLLVGYLTMKGWTVKHQNDRASVWSLTTVEGTDEIGVPSGVQAGSFEWIEILRRIAESEHRAPEKVAQAFEYATFDEVRFRIANSEDIHRTAPLHSGVSLLASAFSMLRATATTAQRLRSQIGTGYSKVGDRYVANARLAHTEEGSYIIPVLFEHEMPDLPHNIEPVAGMEPVALETPQRRIVRTLAQSLETFQRRIIEPGKEVRYQSDLTPVVAAGGSRELFVGLQRVLVDESVAEFETIFGWGLTVPRPGNVPTSVSIPSAAIDLVKQTVTVLTAAQTQPLRIVTGPIVAFEHDPGDPFVRIALQTPSSNGRMSRIYLMTKVDLLEKILSWIKDGVTVTAQGVIERTPGQPLRLAGISEPMRLDDSFITGT